MATATKDISRQSPLWSTGRRKTAIARVRVIPGQGRLIVNGKSLDDYFKGYERQRVDVLAPMKLTKVASGYDIFINTYGGGVTGQAQAVRLGIARALVSIDGQLRGVMRKHGYMTRDPRMVERKKSGQPKARRRFQHSKR